MEVPYDPAILLPGTYPEKMKTLIKKRYMHPNVHSSTISNSHGIEEVQPLINRPMNKENVNAGIKKNETLQIAAMCIDLDNTLSEISQAEKDKYCRIPFICGT